VALHFSSVFVFLLSPQAGFGVLFSFVFMLSYCVYGVSAIVSTLASRKNASLIAAILAMALGSLCGYSPSLKDAGDSTKILKI
jgi:ABC-type multidrug transport system permease subunit